MPLHCDKLPFISKIDQFYDTVKIKKIHLLVHMFIKYKSYWCINSLRFKVDVASSIILFEQFMQDLIPPFTCLQSINIPNLPCIAELPLLR